MALPDLTGLNIEDTYQRVLQTDGVNIYDGTGSIVNIAATGPFATTGSNIFNGTQTINGNVTINGTASISVLNVSIESSSIIYSSGSNQFGDAPDDTQTLYGSVIIPTGSLTVNGNISASGDLNINNTPYQIWIGDGFTDEDSLGSLKLYNQGFKGILSTYYYNSILELRSGVSSSAFVNNWSKIELSDNFGSNGYIRLFTSGSERMRISNTGLVGIGTNIPAHRLDVSGSVRFNGRTHFGTNSSYWLDPFIFSDPYWNAALNIGATVWLGSAGGRVRVGSYVTPTARFEVVGLGSTSATTTMRVDNSAGQTSLAVLDNGVVGVGTTNISASLHVSGAASANLLRIDSPASSSILVITGSGRIGINTATPRTTTELVGTLRITNVGDPSKFNDLSTDLNGYMTLGNIVYSGGIGANTGWVNLFQNFVNVGSGSGYFFTSTANSGTSTRDVGFSRAGINIVAVNDGAAGNANGILLASKISIGRGLAAPVATLDVSGSGRITNNLSVTGSLDVTGSIKLNNANIQSLMIAYSIALG